jgi:RHS repeat-associated protein
VPTAGSRTTVDRPIAVVDLVNTASPVTWFVHVDHLNRPIKMTNAAKAAVWDAAWLPWGGVHSITGAATLDARFPGQWFQLETGLHYNWHRSYDPSIGRYTQPDPLGFVDGPSVYGYARGGPQNLVDKDGRAVCTYSVATRKLTCRSTNVPPQPDYTSPPGQVKSGHDRCQDNTSCFGEKGIGPTPPGNYSMVPGNMASGEPGWRLQPPISSPNRWKCWWNPDDPSARCGMFLHAGSISYGCITVDRTAWGGLAGWLSNEQGPSAMVVNPQ